MTIGNGLQFIFEGLRKQAFLNRRFFCFGFLRGKRTWKQFFKD